MGFNKVLCRPQPGTICIAVPHGTDLGLESLDPAGVEIKAYDGDYVWMLTNRTHHVTTHIKHVTFHPAKSAKKSAVLSPKDWKNNGRALYISNSCAEFQHGDSYYVARVAEHETISSGVVTQAVGDVLIRSNTAAQPFRFSTNDASKSFQYIV